MLWLSAAEITPGQVQRLLEHYHSLEEVWEAFGKDDDLHFPVPAQYVLQRYHSHTAIDDLMERLERKNVKLLFQDDPAYPELLASIEDPPYLLYYAGKLSCLNRPTVAIVGTRRASSYGLEMAASIARGVAEAGVGVVSGLARGIDAAAHNGALEVGGVTVGILGSGINVPYPAEHTTLLRKIAGGIGLVLSEYPLDAQPMPFHFPHRNRIISGLSQGVVLVEGRVKSGGMHTVHAALMQGREVFAVPGRIGSFGSEGPHALLREGARIITSAEDLLDDLGLLKSGEEPSDAAVDTSRLTHLQQQIVSQLHLEPCGSQAIAQALGANEADIITELGTLEIMGVARREAGNRFYLPIQAKQ